ncbi:MAG: helix-turn-helix domain-containing protein [Nocardioides sp.]|uniref:helix-turn-helix domain-containing protein n=1 Tax=Nocardioides sp. TaxID=35761 RepID=UPI0039E27D11
MTDSADQTNDPATDSATDPGAAGADPRVLRAIAHPVRNRIIGEMEAAGPMRAADVAAVMGIPANQASFHLRQLAKYGLVEEAPEAARDGRDRVWRLTSGDQLRIDVSRIEEAPGGQAAVNVWRRHASARAHELVDRAYELRRREGTSSAIIEGTIRLTRDEAGEFATALDQLFDEWVARTRGAADDAPRETYHLFALLQPYDAD